MKATRAMFVITVAISLSILSVSLLGCHKKVPPKCETTSLMHSLLLRILDHVEVNHELPRDLHELAPRDGYGNSLMDGWRNEIMYRIGNDNNVTIISYGADGKKGGSGEAEDISYTFNPYDIETYYNAIGMVSPMSLTKHQLNRIRDAIIEYTKANQKLPSSLEFMPFDRTAYGNMNIDFWGNEIIYEINGDTVTLKSLGKYGAVGGDGESADIELSFEIEQL